METNRMTITNTMGMGCWSIGGPFYSGDKPLGFANVDDDQSKRAIDAALDCGIRLFDTAAVYGAGHSERLLGNALKHRDDVFIISKLGMPFDEHSLQVLEQQFTATDVIPSIDDSRQRLQRDTIDVILLHQNAMNVAQATPLFEQMELARQRGKIKWYGWSTDFPASVAALSSMPGFTYVEHAMNVFIDAPTMQDTVLTHDLTALIRSPLAMGVLSGKFSPESIIPAHDHRSLNSDWHDYFNGSRVNDKYLSWINTIGELLRSDGRTLAQGSLAWLWGKSARNIPIPGARTETQIIENAGALEYGPLSQGVMDEIESVINRPPEGEARFR